MAESRDHARLGPSAAHRWIHCHGSVRLVEELEARPGGLDTGSVWAAEGTAAHTVAEMIAGHRNFKITEDQLTIGLAVLAGEWATAPWLGGRDVADALAEMIEHAHFYADVIDRERGRQSYFTELHLELKVDPDVPGVWGTGDAVIIGPDEVAVIDYKYGSGVRVDAPSNEQLMFYGLGGVEADLIGTATTVRVIIVQPRLDHVSEWELPIAELRKWRDDVARPAAELAVSADAPFGPSEKACQFCPARGRCTAQMQWIADRDFGADPDLMTPEYFADALEILPAVRAWASAVEEKALEQAYSNGVEIPGWKVVMSGGQRKITDPAAAIERLVEAGYDRAKITKPEQIETLGNLEKVVKVGRKKVLDATLGPDLIKRAEGRPALVPEDDLREGITANSTAADDFAED
jgi:hypothetical protein